MPSLRELVTSHAPLLFLDAASTRIQVGLWGSKGRGRWQTSDEEAGIGIFRCLEQLDFDLEHIRAFVFCEGPGSILGIRTVAMALRTWRLFSPKPVFSYSALALAAHALGRTDVAVIADARRDTWHYYKLGESLRRVPTAELAGVLAMPDHFRHWSALPPDLVLLPYAVEELLSRVEDANLFRLNEAPDAFLHDEPSYVTWMPQIHRAR